MPAKSSSKQQKWNQAYQDADFSNASPADVLWDHQYLFETTQGNALDLACGRAGNAQLLTKRGFQVDAVDFSSVVIEGLRAYVKQQSLHINCLQRDIESDGLSATKYDLIVVSYFLNRALFPQIINALKPGGLLFYQTWSQLAVDKSGPSNPNFRLAAGELLTLCSSMRIIKYQEDGNQGDNNKGLRNEALIIAQRSTKRDDLK